MNKKVLIYICRVAAAVTCLGAAGCTDGIYSKVTPAYDLAAYQDRKVFIWVESPRSAGADMEAPEALSTALRDRLIAQAKIRPENILLAAEQPSDSASAMKSAEAAALEAGAELALLVRIEDYELMPMQIRNYHSGRMLTRALLLDVMSGQTLWPVGYLRGQGKMHDIVIELGEGDRREILSRLASSTAHCIVRNLYPIMKMHYKTSDERVSLQEAFEMETF